MGGVGRPFQQLHFSPGFADRDPATVARWRHGREPRNALTPLARLAVFDAIPGRQQVILGGGYMINMERPAEFNQTLREWLAASAG